MARLCRHAGRHRWPRHYHPPEAVHPQRQAKVDVGRGCRPPPNDLVPVAPSSPFLPAKEVFHDFSEREQDIEWYPEKESQSGAARRFQAWEQKNEKQGEEKRAEDTDPWFTSRTSLA